MEQQETINFKVEEYKDSVYVYHNGEMEETEAWEILDQYGYKLDKWNYIENEKCHYNDYIYRHIFHNNP